MGQGNADRFVRSVPQPNLIQAGNNDTGEGFKLASNSMNLLGSILDLAKANKNDKIAMTKAKNTVSSTMLEELEKYNNRLDPTDPDKYNNAHTIQVLKLKVLDATQNGRDFSADADSHLQFQKLSWNLLGDQNAKAKDEAIRGKAVTKEENKKLKEQQLQSNRAMEGANKQRKGENQMVSQFRSAFQVPEQVNQEIGAAQMGQLQPKSPSQTNSSMFTGGQVNPVVQSIPQVLKRNAPNMEGRSTVQQKVSPKLKAQLVVEYGVDKDVVESLTPEQANEIYVYGVKAKLEAKNKAKQTEKQDREYWNTYDKMEKIVKKEYETRIKNSGSYEELIRWKKHPEYYADDIAEDTKKRTEARIKERSR